MNNEDLKKKIEDIVAMAMLEADELPFIETTDNIADALIAAGLKFDVLTETEYQKYCAYKIIEPQIKGCLDREKELEKRLAKAERRAEVAERALEERATYRAMKDLDYFSLTTVAVEARAKELYNGWVQQAEKDLAKENRNDKD